MMKTAPAARRSESASRDRWKTDKFLCERGKRCLASMAARNEELCFKKVNFD